MLDSLFRVEVVEMSPEAPVCRDKVDDSSDNCLDLVAISSEREGD